MGKEGKRRGSVDMNRTVVIDQVLRRCRGMYTRDQLEKMEMEELYKMLPKVGEEKLNAPPEEFDNKDQAGQAFPHRRNHSFWSGGKTR